MVAKVLRNAYITYNRQILSFSRDFKSYVIMFRHISVFKPKKEKKKVVYTPLYAVNITYIRW